jgi:hypothetical protein
VAARSFLGWRRAIGSAVAADPTRTSDALHERALGFVRAFEAGLPMPESFDALATDLARFQAANVPGFARLCRARGADPGSFKLARDVPAVPTDAFKLSRVAWFSPEETRATFLTSGTTAGARGTHRMRRPETYDAAALAFGRWALTSDLEEPPRVLILGPSEAETPESSLARMMTLFANRLGAPEKRPVNFVNDGILELAALDQRVAEATVQGKSVLLLATSFALVHLLDALDGGHFRLPPSSRVMQTGGFKGRSREIDAAQLRSELAEALGLEQRAIVAEYGMTELASQFYEATLRGGEPGVYHEPPWARVEPVDPETLEPVPEGEVGIARICDLMNVDSAVVVLTADRVRRKGAGVELLGRSPGAPPRGCSLGLDELVGEKGMTR